MIRKITFVHLFNDFSGSPRVLATVIKHFVEAGQEVELMTSSGGEGFLSNLTGIKYRPFQYQFLADKQKRAGMLLRSQFRLFLEVLKTEKDQIIYINTLLPFGAAIAGKLTGHRVIYHIHETTVNPPFLKRFLKWVAQKCATEVIYVSRFLQKTEALPQVRSYVVHNALSSDFSKRATRFMQKSPNKKGDFTVLMLCSLKRYKGVDEFVKLACALPSHRFILVLNANFEVVKNYFDMDEIPENLVIFPAQKDVHNFYEAAHLVVNLSHPERWVETFGMTLLEGMNYGLPVIAPPVGGPTEVVVDGENGFLINPHQHDEIVKRIQFLAENKARYEQMSKSALAISKKFEESSMKKEILQILGVPLQQKVVPKTLPTASPVH